MSIIQRVPWTVQPQGATLANGQWVARGLVELIPAWLGVSTQYGVREQITGAWEKRVYSKGKSLYIATDVPTTNRAVYPGSFSRLAAPFSFLCFYVSSGQLTSHRVAGNFASASYGYGIIPTTTNYRAVVARAGTNTVLTGSAYSTSAAVQKIDVITCDATNVSYWENGLLTAGPTAHGGITTATGDFSFGADNLAAVNNGGGHYYLAALFNRILTSSEIRLLSDNPWQLFAPQTRRIWAPSSAGGTSYTITPSGGVVIGGTSVDIKGKVLTVSGGVSMGGDGSMTFASGGTTYTITPSGGVVFAGTGNSINSKVFLPSGGITMGGTSDMIKTKIISPSNGVLLGGTGSMTSNTTVITGTVGERTKVGAGT